jgi:hypothetical protein
MSCLAQTCTCNRTSACMHCRAMQDCFLACTTRANACMHCRAMQDCFLACTTRANACNFTRLWSAWNARLACQYFNHKTQENIITVLNKIAVDYTCLHTWYKVTPEICLNCDCCCTFYGEFSLWRWWSYAN